MWPATGDKTLRYFGGRERADCTVAFEKAVEYLTDPGVHRYAAEAGESGYFLVKGPRLLIPEGVYYYDGPGIDWPAGASTMLAISGIHEQISKINVQSDAWLLDMTKNATAFDLRKLTISGGKGAVRFSNIGVNTVRPSRIERCVFVDYDTCAIGHNSQDWPGFKVNDCTFRGTDTSIGIVLSGLAAEGGVRDCVFQRNKYHIKLCTTQIDGDDKGPAVPINLIGNSFFRYVLSAGNVHDIWITPNADTWKNAGRAIYLGQNKFGNEQLQAGDSRILIANQDMESGVDACTRSHSTIVGGHINGLCTAKNNINNATEGSPNIPYVLTYAEMSNCEIDDIMESSQAGPLVQYAAGLSNSDFRSESSQNRLSLRQMIGYDVVAVARPISRPAGWIVDDPHGYCLDPSVPVHFTGGGAGGNVVHILDSAKTSTFTVAGATGVAISNSCGEAGEALELTCSASDGRAYSTMNFSRGRDSEILWIEGELKQSASSSITRIKIDLLDSTPNVILRRYFAIGSDWRFFRIPIVHSEASRGLLTLRIVAGDYAAGSKTKFQLGRVRAYHAPEPVNTGAVSGALAKLQAQDATPDADASRITLFFDGSLLKAVLPGGTVKTVSWT